MVDHLTQGYRLAQPNNCPNDVWVLIQKQSKLFCKQLCDMMIGYEVKTLTFITRLEVEINDAEARVAFLGGHRATY